jgi:hypothetical protein
VAIQYQGAPIYFQGKLPTDLFWQFPLSPVLNRDQEAAHAQEEVNVCIANSTTALPFDKDFVAFMHHAAFGSPCPSTFLRALRRNRLDTIPRLTSALFSANKPKSFATALGHLDQTRQGLNSTKGKRVVTTPPSPDPTPDPPNDPDELPTVDPYDPEGVDTFDDLQSFLLFCLTFATADIDASGRFPVLSSRRNEYHLLSHFKGYVHVEPLPSRTQTAYIDAYKRTYAYPTLFG